jgi:hypothetical protein
MDSLNKITFLFFIFLFWGGSVSAAPKADLWPRWQAHDQSSTIQVNHGVWDDFLQKYLVTGDPSGINRLRYKKVNDTDKKALQHYLDTLQEVSVSKLNRKEQKAYWINFYNALTIKVILDHYPVKSIRDIDISPGFFSDGPWDKKLGSVEGFEISLNDIEHRILRPIWKDNRVHYAVNCASIGCPNLQPEPFTAGNTDALLAKGAREYINNQRGADLAGSILTVSSIYKWFQEDFDNSEQGILEHLEKYADEKLAGKLHNFKGKIQYNYDWSLNE